MTAPPLSIGEACHADIVFTQREGLVQYPRWYPSCMGAESSFAEVQTYLYEVGTCASAPCDYAAESASLAMGGIVTLKVPTSIVTCSKIYTFIEL